MPAETLVVDSIREWVSYCKAHHAKCAELTLDAMVDSCGKSRPSWLIDVRRRSLVPGSVQGDYLALSYTWQENTPHVDEYTHPLELLTSNINLLKRRDGLESGKKHLPKVIRDAMELTVATGAQFLWVDRLCIVQDDPRKISEFMQMDNIYAGALWTIIGAADCGLFDAPETTLRSPRRCSWSMPNETADSRVAAYYRAVLRSNWAKRAWTYQEYILSNRVVFFVGTDIFWQCECAVWDMQFLHPSRRDSAVGEEGPPPSSRFIRQLKTPTTSDLSLYADVVCPYNGRDLTYLEDGLAACLGILHRLMPAFPGGFIFGLPRLYFDFALLWQPLKGSYSSLKLSDPSSHDEAGGRMDLPTRRPTLPSWAWCGWQCVIDPKSLQMAHGLGRTKNRAATSTSSWTFESIAKWEYMAELQESSRRCEADGQETPPPAFRWLPVSAATSAPLCTIISADVPYALLCPAATFEIRSADRRKRKAGFMVSYVNPALQDKPLIEMPRVVVLMNKSRCFSGLLRITGEGICPLREKMELIAISQGTVNGKDLANCFEEMVFRKSIYYTAEKFHAVYNENNRWIKSSSQLSCNDQENYQVDAIGECENALRLLPEDYEDTRIYHFYNVLWVKYDENGTGYRAGCGRVLRSYWKRDCSGKRPIRLG